MQPHEYTLGDIILGTQKITEDCESDGVELDNYLPVSHSKVLYFITVAVLYFAVFVGISFPWHFRFMFHQVIITHGLCHLLGYTHDTQENLDKVCLFSFVCELFLMYI